MATRYAAMADTGRQVTSQMVTGGGGVQLHVVESGNPRGRPIVFIHGFSQCWLAWSRQISSDLADDYRLVAMDLRGHGLSEKPCEATATRDCGRTTFDAVIRALDLDQPVLCGWSYGPLVILDYIRHYGEDGIGGINFVGGITKLGQRRGDGGHHSRVAQPRPGSSSRRMCEESVRSLEALVRLCFARRALAPTSCT